MARFCALLLVLLGLGSATYLAPDHLGLGSIVGSSPPHLEATAPIAGATTAAAAEQAGMQGPAAPRVFSAKSPLYYPEAQAAGPQAGPVRIATSESPVRTTSAVKAGGEDDRRKLARDLQSELRRVGCFEGDADGTWSAASRKAMAAFVEDVNATLPVEQPDYVLLTLVQGHRGPACGKGCAVGLALAKDGRCVPKAIVAQRPKPRTEPPVEPVREAKAKVVSERETTREAKETKTAAARAPGAPGLGTSTSGWTTIVAAEPTERAIAVAPVAPLPGRMTVGGPRGEPPPHPGAEIASREALTQPRSRTDTERLKAQAEAARAEARRRLEPRAATAPPSRPLSNEPSSGARTAAFAATASLPHPVETSSGRPGADAAATSRPAPQSAKAAIEENEAAPLRNSASPNPSRAAVQSSDVEEDEAAQPRRKTRSTSGNGNGYGSAAPSRPRQTPPTAVHRSPPAFVTRAPRPVYVQRPVNSYQPTAQRWTRTLFSDITRMR